MGIAKLAAVAGLVALAAGLGVNAARVQMPASRAANAVEGLEVLALAPLKVHASWKTGFPVLVGDSLPPG